MAETDTETTALAPRELVTEIERTRANLAQTIDEIADRVAPGNIARRAGDRAKERISQIDPLIGSAVALAAVGVTCYLIWRRIRELAREKKRSVIAFVEDAAASGGYMIACAADEIIADPNSVVGSIGVVGGSFGFDKLIAKIGVERRLYTSGAHKAMLDPFLPENPEDVSRLKALQREIHDIFIALVKGSRGARLKGADDVLFTGEYWAGDTSVSLGLADAIGDLRSTLRTRYGEKVQTPLIAPSSGMLSGLLGRRSPGAIGTWENTANLPEEMISALESRAIWAKFGF